MSGLRADPLAPMFVYQLGVVPAAPGQFRSPSALAVAGSNNLLYVLDAGNQRIQRFAPNGTNLTQWGSFGPNRALVVGLSGLAVDTGGSVYVAEQGGIAHPDFNLYETFWSVGKF